jgi:hypothetical protein
MIPKSQIKYKNDLGFDCTNLINKIFNPYDNINIVNENLFELFKLYNIPNIFVNKNINEKLIDFIYNGRCTKFKKTFEICKYFSILAEKGFKCAMILLNFEKNSYYDTCINYYNSLNESIKRNFILIDASVLNTNNKKYHGFNLNEIAIFCKTSNVYVHGSLVEGTSRSLNEAICCGCIILANEKARGGILEYVTNENGVLYNNNNLILKSYESINKSKTYICGENNISNISEIYTTDKIFKTLYNIFNYNEKMCLDEFINNLDKNDLQLNFAGHNNNVPWKIVTDDVSHILTLEQVNLFMNYLTCFNI